MKNFYKKIKKSNYVFNNAPVQLQNYYNSLKGKDGVIVINDKEGESLLVPTELIGEFVVTVVTRDDIKTNGYDGDSMSDDDMHSFAEDFEDSLLDSGEFAAYVSDLAMNLGLDEVEEVEEEEDLDEIGEQD